MHQHLRALLALAIAAVAVVPPAVAAAAPPPNDNLAGAQALASDFGSVLADNAEASAEEAQGEPDHANSGFGPAHSLWYRWSPAVNDVYTFDTCGSSFDTRLAIYTGAGYGSLTPVAANDDSAGSMCPGTKASELSSGLSAGTEYLIAVDTMGPLPGCPEAHTRGPLRLRLDGAGSAEQLPCDSPPPTGPTWTNPARPRPATDVQFTVPRLNPDKTDFANAILVERWLIGLRKQGLDYVMDADPFSSRQADTKAQREHLRERGVGGEIINASIGLERPDGTNQVPLTEGEEYRVVSTEGRLDIDIDFFHPELDKKAIADERRELEREARERAERERKEREAREAKSRCLPIAAGQSAKQIEAEHFPKWTNPFFTFNDAIAILSKLGCDVQVAKYVRGKPSAPHAYVKEVVDTHAKRHQIDVALGQPGSHDFVFTIRENPGDFGSQAANSNIPPATDGRLTVSDKQHNRLTVQVIERASGRLVAGIPVTFVGKRGEAVSQQTDGNGETTFVSSLEREAEYRLSAEFGEMEGYRTMKAVDRGRKAFTSMAGRRIVASNKGLFGPASRAELDLAKSLPVVPANLGTGRVGEVGAIPVVRQADVFTVGSAGQPVVGQHNVVSLPNNSEVLVGAGPGVVAIGGGTPGQVGRPTARAGIGNPLDFLGQILGGLRSAIDTNIASVRNALGGAQASILAAANLIGQAGGNLISDKGLGVISVGGGNLIGQAGGNLISDKGLGVISVGGGNLIGQAGGNLIGQAGGNLLSTGDNDLMPVFGGNIISRDGAS